MATRQSYAIEAHDLVKTYPKDVRALDRLSLTVGQGEIFGLLGRNGAGKTTAVKVLTTLARPDSGTARVAGLDVLRQAGRVRTVIGVVSQRSSADPSATARENLILQGRMNRMPGAALRRRAEELLDRFDLGEAAGRRVRTFSGGMQRRLEVALGLVHRPQVLFLDEPTTGLDPEARAAMWREIAALAGDEGLTILLTTHYLEEADRLADRLAIVDRGRVVATGTAEELKGQLHGDAVRVEFAAVPDEATAQAARAALAAVPGVAEVALDGRWLTARTADGAAAVPDALAALERAGAAVAAITAARPSLDDVYLRYAGGAPAGAGGSGGEVGAGAGGGELSSVGGDR